jgi:BirA family transcriptional regulator, biotin operon repressor / biotin---[acetyl-CoA-carboxylase] ligase
MPVSNFQLIRLDRVASTQEEARDRARSGCQGGTLILAAEQTAGRGRGERKWESARGLGLWCTLVHRSLRSKREWPALTIVASTAICDAIEASGLRPQSRWPNDVLLSARKVSGVLADTEADAILIGIGVNLLQASADFPADLRGIATSIGIESHRAGIPPPEGDGFLHCLLPFLDQRLRDFERAGPSSVMPAFWERSIDRSRRLAVRLPSDDVVEGTAIGLGEIGQLLIDTPEGIIAVASGTIIGREGE